jgi:hypothetical protein
MDSTRPSAYAFRTLQASVLFINIHWRTDLFRFNSQLVHTKFRDRVAAQLTSLELPPVTRHLLICLADNADTLVQMIPTRPVLSQQLGMEYMGNTSFILLWDVYYSIAASGHFEPIRNCHLNSLGTLPARPRPS